MPTGYFHGTMLAWSGTPAVGILSALYKLKEDPSSGGQEIDCSATEAMLRTLEFLAIEYDQLGAVRTRSGNRSQYAAPGNVYQTADGKWASIAASTQSIFERLCTALNLRDLLTDERFATNPARVRNYKALDVIVGGIFNAVNKEVYSARESDGPKRRYADKDLRDWTRHGKFNVTQGKAWDSTGSMGPWMTTDVDLTKPLHITCKINGEVTQDDTTDSMIFKFLDILPYVSTFMTLKPGDIIATGTPIKLNQKDGERKWLKAGDTFEMTVPEVGTLKNVVRDEA